MSEQTTPMYPSQSQKFNYNNYSNLAKILAVVIVVMILFMMYHYANMSPDYYNLTLSQEQKLWESGDVETRKKIIIAKLYNLYNDTVSQFPESDVIDEYLVAVTYDQLLEGFQTLTMSIKEEIAYRKANPNVSNSNVDKLMQCLSA